MQYYLGNKINIEEFKRAIDSKVNFRDFEAEVKSIRAGQDHSLGEIYRKLEFCVTDRDMQKIYRNLESKANL